MALLFMDGFDSTTTREGLYDNGWDSLSGSIGVSFGTSPHGDYAPRGSLRHQGGGGEIARKYLPTNPNVVIAGFHWWNYDQYSMPDSTGWSTWGNIERGLVDLKQGGGFQFRLTAGEYASNDYPVRVWNGNNTFLGAGSTKILNQVWYHIAFKVKLHETEGTVDVYVDGVREIALTGVRTINTANAWCDDFAVQIQRQHNSSRYGYIDNLYIFDDSGTTCNEVLPQARIISVVPNSDDIVADWTGTFEDVNETSANDGNTSYITASNVGDESRFNFVSVDGLGLVPNPIYHAVQFKGWTRAVNGNYYTILTATYNGSQLLSTEWRNTNDYRQTRIPGMMAAPDGTPLSAAIVDAIQGGVKITKID